MRKLIILLLVLCLAVSCPAEAKTVKVKKLTYLGNFFITYYCPCSECCGVGGGTITASGTTPTVGRTVGVNPGVIKYGTKLKIGNKSGYVAEDTGGGIGTYHIDIFVNSHQEALNLGVSYKDVWAITYERHKIFKAKKQTLTDKKRLKWFKKGGLFIGQRSNNNANNMRYDCSYNLHNQGK